MNLSKNGVALTAAYNKVVDGKSDTNWWVVTLCLIEIKPSGCCILICVQHFRVLFTYEGNSNDIRLAGSGGKSCFVIFSVQYR